MINEPPKILIIAGPNGAGKTTFAREFLVKEAQCPDFINADLIAAGLAPFQPATAAVQAGRIMLSEIQKRVNEKRSFAFETTLSGKIYARRIPLWQMQGFTVKLFFLDIVSVEIALARVAARVAQGGHSIPDEVVRRRFSKSRGNFERTYKPLVDAWALYDNSSECALLIGEGSNE